MENFFCSRSFFVFLLLLLHCPPNNGVQGHAVANRTAPSSISFRTTVKPPAGTVSEEESIVCRSRETEDYVMTSSDRKEQEVRISAAPFQGDTTIFRFAPEKQMFWADYKGNAAAIDSLTRSIRQYKLPIESGDMKIRILGFCSSYGSFAENLAAAKDRSNQVKSYFIVHEGLKEEHFRTTNSTRKWHGTTDVIAVAYLFLNSETVPDSGTLPERDLMPADSVSANEAPASQPESKTSNSSVKPDMSVAEKSAGGQSRRM